MADLKFFQNRTTCPVKADSQSSPSYLVVAHHNMDDIPIALTKSMEEAKSIVDNYTLEQSDQTYAIMGWDQTEFCGSMSIITFIDGRPGKLFHFFKGGGR